jgi:hypothetical protein
LWACLRGHTLARSGRAKAEENVEEVNVLGWFAREELRTCPVCREHAALPGEDGRLLICLACGEPLALTLVPQEATA